MPVSRPGPARTHHPAPTRQTAPGRPSPRVASPMVGLPALSARHFPTLQRNLGNAQVATLLPVQRTVEAAQEYDAMGAPITPTVAGQQADEHTSDEPVEVSRGTALYEFYAGFFNVMADSAAELAQLGAGVIGLTTASGLVVTIGALLFGASVIGALLAAFAVASAVLIGLVIGLAVAGMINGYQDVRGTIEDPSLVGDLAAAGLTAANLTGLPQLLTAASGRRLTDGAALAWRQRGQEYGSGILAAMMTLAGGKSAIKAGLVAGWSSRARQALTGMRNAMARSQAAFAEMTSRMGVRSRVGGSWTQSSSPKSAPLMVGEELPTWTRQAPANDTLPAHLDRNPVPANDVAAAEPMRMAAGSEYGPPLPDVVGEFEPGALTDPSRPVGMGREFHHRQAVERDQRRRALEAAKPADGGSSGAPMSRRSKLAGGIPEELIPNWWDEKSGTKVPPIMTVAEVVHWVEKAGWVKNRNGKGDHRAWTHPTRPGTLSIDGAPNHRVPKGTLMNYLRTAGEWWP